MDVKIRLTCECSWTLVTLEWSLLHCCIHGKLKETEVTFLLITSIIIKLISNLDKVNNLNIHQILNNSSMCKRKWMLVKTNLYASVYVYLVWIFGWSVSGTHHIEMAFRPCGFSCECPNMVSGKKLHYIEYTEKAYAYSNSLLWKKSMDNNTIFGDIFWQLCSISFYFPIIHRMNLESFREKTNIACN